MAGQAGAPPGVCRSSFQYGTSFLAPLPHHLLLLLLPFMLLPPRRAKADGPYDSRFLPVLLTVCMILSMSVVFGGAVFRLSST